MLIKPTNLEYTGGKTYIDSQMDFSISAELDGAYVKELWHNFTYGKSELILTETDTISFTNQKETVLSAEGCEYALCVDGKISIVSHDARGLLHGIYTLLDMISYDEQGIFLANCRVKDSPKVENIMVHVCVFPETEYSFIMRTIKYCAFLKYTHMVLEFWGMLAFDCMEELGWKNAWSKEQVRELCTLAKRAGIQLIPMFNHLGHAAQARLCSGKHVVLDQNMKYYDLFDPDGWIWNINNQKTLELLGEVRRELCDIFTDSAYFHIGCDEVFLYGHDPEKASLFAQYVNDVAEDLKKFGKRTIIWGDMLQHKGAHAGDGNEYEFYCGTEEIAKVIRENISREIVIADWQYAAKKYPVKSALFLKERGFDVLVCPWFGDENVRANVQTAVQDELLGVMCTTWNSLESNLPYLAVSAAECRLGVEQEGEIDGLKIFTDHYASVAPLIRKLDHPNGDYARSGWLKKQI